MKKLQTVEVRCINYVNVFIKLIKQNLNPQAQGYKTTFREQ